MEEQPRYRCPIELGVAATEKRIEGFDEEAKQKDFITHDVIRNTAADRQTIDSIQELGECTGAVMVDGEIRCPYMGAFAVAQKLQYVNGETVHADGRMQTPAIIRETKRFIAEREGMEFDDDEETDAKPKPDEHHGGQYL
jgi:hypothetical protein